MGLAFNNLKISIKIKIEPTHYYCTIPWILNVVLHKQEVVKKINIINDPQEDVQILAWLINSQGNSTFILARGHSIPNYEKYYSLNKYAK